MCFLFFFEYYNASRSVGRCLCFNDSCSDLEGNTYFTAAPGHELVFYKHEYVFPKQYPGVFNAQVIITIAASIIGLLGIIGEWCCYLFLLN